MNKFLKLWLLGGIFKILLAALLPLSADEAYYWVWSQNLQLSYFDHPGMIAWLLKLGQVLESVGLVRWPIVVLGHFTVLIWYFLLKNHANEKSLLWFLSLFLFSPLIGFGSIIATPDVPVLFFWSLSAFLFTRALDSSRALSYTLLGLTLGLGFCSKYHIVLLVPAFVIYLSLQKKWSQVKFKNIACLVAAGFVFSLPVLIWNYQNGFASFKFQMDHGMGRSHWDPYWTWSYLLGSFFLCFPPFLWLVFKRQKSDLLIYLKILTLFPLGFFLFTSFRGHVELNWPIVAMPSLFALAALTNTRPYWIQIHNVFWGTLVLILTVNHWYPVFKKIPDRLNEESYYRPLVAWTQTQQPTYASTYQMASILWYMSKNPIYKLPQMSRIDYYDKINNPLPEKPFYLLRETEASLPAWIREQSFVIENRQRINQDFELVYFVKK